MRVKGNETHPYKNSETTETGHITFEPLLTGHYMQVFDQAKSVDRCTVGMKNPGCCLKAKVR